MEIPSALNSGLQGLQSARMAAEQAAVDIIASTQLSAEQQQSSAHNSEVSTEVSTEVSNTSHPQELPDLNQAIVNLKVADFQAKASIEIIRSADDFLGTLLDVTA